MDRLGYSVLRTTLAVAVVVISAPALAQAAPFQTVVTVSMPDNATARSVNFTVPAGKRLIVENLSGRGAASNVTMVHLSQGGGLTAVLPVVRASASGWNWHGTTPTKVYFSAGNVSVTVSRSAAGACGSCSTGNYVTVTGTLRSAADADTE